MTLYRQYRPSSFQELLGQESVATLLQNALAQGRLSHAYLFSGPRGTGKTTTARLLAKAATCLDPKVIISEDKNTTFEACGTCVACIAQQENRAHDIIEIDAASNRGIEDIRELRDQATYPPLQLKYKVYIIDEVHMLTNEAFNALLKTLEEPSQQTIFILATTELHKVPATIRSRCQLLRFRAASTQALQKKMRTIVKAEKWTVDAEAVTLIIEHAQGGFRDAETLLEQLATEHQPLTAELVSATLGILAPTTVSELLSKTLSGDTQAVYNQLVDIRTTATFRPEQLTLQLIQGVREELGKEKARLGLLTFALNQLLEAYILHRSSPLPLLPLEIACLTIAEHASSPQKNLSQASQAPAIEQHVRVTVVPERAIQPVTKASAPDLLVQSQPVPRSDVPVVELREKAITDIRNAWKEMVLDIGKDNAPLSQMLRETVFHSAEGTEITIYVRFKFHVEKLSEKKNKIKVEKILHELTHTAWNIQFILGENMPKRVQRKEIGASAEDAAAIFGAS